MSITDQQTEFVKRFILKNLGGSSGTVAGKFSITKLGKARIEWIAVRREGLAQVDHLQQIIRTVYSDMPDAQSTIASALARISGAIGQLDDSLTDDLDAVLNADAADRPKLADAVAKTVRGFASLCDGDPILRHIDGNEFNQDTRVVGPIKAKLAEIEKAIGL